VSGKRPNKPLLKTPPTEGFSGDRSYRLFLFDELEDYELAIEQLTSYLKNNPHSGIAYNNRGLAYAEIGYGDEALLDYAKAIESLPTDPIPYINRGYLYERAGRLHEAIDNYTQATVIKGDDATFHRCRAHACFAASQLQEAITVLVLLFILILNSGSLPSSC
jgi:tetratricopeptide (TPR) repeat protein